MRSRRCCNAMKSMYATTSSQISSRMDPSNLDIQKLQLIHSRHTAQPPNDCTLLHQRTLHLPKLEWRDEVASLRRHSFVGQATPNGNLSEFPTGLRHQLDYHAAGCCTIHHLETKRGHAVKRTADVRVVAKSATTDTHREAYGPSLCSPGIASTRSHRLHRSTDIQAASLSMQHLEKGKQ